MIVEDGSGCFGLALIPLHLTAPVRYLLRGIRDSQGAFTIQLFQFVPKQITCAVSI